MDESAQGEEMPIGSVEFGCPCGATVSASDGPNEGMATVRITCRDCDRRYAITITQL